MAHKTTNRKQAFWNANSLIPLTPLRRTRLHWFQVTEGHLPHCPSGRVPRLFSSSQNNGCCHTWGVSVFCATGPRATGKAPRAAEHATNGRTRPPYCNLLWSNWLGSLHCGVSMVTTNICMCAAGLQCPVKLCVLL